MRGLDARSGSLFSYVDIESRVRADHPLRTIREIANAALTDLSGEFAALYPARLGRPSIPTERLLRAMLLQAFYGIRSERLLAERIEFDLDATCSPTSKATTIGSAFTRPLATSPPNRPSGKRAKPRVRETRGRITTAC